MKVNSLERIDIGRYRLGMGLSKNREKRGGGKMEEGGMGRPTDIET